MALISKKFLHSKNQHKMKQTEETMVYRNYPFTPLKEDPNNKENPVRSDKKTKPP
jgi:hypothetical protein